MLVWIIYGESSTVLREVITFSGRPPNLAESDTLQILKNTISDNIHFLTMISTFVFRINALMSVSNVFALHPSHSMYCDHNLCTCLQLIKLTERIGFSSFLAKEKELELWNSKPSSHLYPANVKYELWWLLAILIFYYITIFSASNELLVIISDYQQLAIIVNTWTLHLYEW